MPKEKKQLIFYVRSITLQTKLNHILKNKKIKKLSIIKIQGQAENMSGLKPMLLLYKKKKHCNATIGEVKEKDVNTE